MSSTVAFGRLCVETHVCGAGRVVGTAVAFGRLCVETYEIIVKVLNAISRLRAAVC